MTSRLLLIVKFLLSSGFLVFMYVLFPLVTCMCSLIEFRVPSIGSQVFYGNCVTRVRNC